MGRYVVPDMVVSRYGPYSDDQIARLPYLIEDAEVECRSGRDLRKRLRDGDTDVDTVVLVVCELVNDVLRNPLGLRSHSQTTGSFTDHQTFAGSPGDEVALSARHRRLLGDRIGGAFTIAPGGSS